MCILSTPTPPRAPPPPPPPPPTTTSSLEQLWGGQVIVYKLKQLILVERTVKNPWRTQARLKPVPWWVCASRILSLMSGTDSRKSLDTASPSPTPTPTPTPSQMLCSKVLDYVKLLSIALTLSRLWTRPTYQRIQKTKTLLVKSHWVDPLNGLRRGFRNFKT